MPTWLAYRYPDPGPGASGASAAGSRRKDGAKRSSRRQERSGGEQLDIPDLRLLPAESLVLHEHADEKRVARLESRLRTDSFLKNPPVVAPIPGTDRYVVLDGANRTSAIARIGCPHVMVQLVDYKADRVQLQTWHHRIAGPEPA